MPQQEIKPVINLNFSDPTVKELTRFTKFLTENFKTEPNLSITVKVLECLMFVKLNFSWIRYAVINKEKDDTIYKYTQDKVKRVLRAHNDMSFHIIMYEDPEKAISDYSNIISAIENKIDLLLENLAYAKTFIRKIQDSSVGCMEARLELALNFIIDPTIPKLDDLFQDFFAEQTQLGVESEDIDKFIPHLIKYFVKKIGDEYIYDGKNITLSWDEIKYYLNNFFGYDDELKPLNLFNDAIITKKENSYVLHFPSEKMAEKYLNLIQLSLPSDLYFKLKNTKIIKTELVFHNKPNKNFLYTFQLTEEQIHIITILLNTTINNVLSQKDCNLLISSLITTLTNNFEAIKPLIEQYPALKNFIINTDGDLLIHFLVQNNELEQLKVLVKTYRFDINARINKPGTYKHGMTSLNLACYLQNVTTEILEYLLQAGANVNIPSDRGVLPLEQLVYSCNPASKVKIFLDNCKTVPKVNNSLIYAINKNSTEVVAQILSIPEIDINYTNSNGESALFAAAKIGEITKLRLLLNFEHIDLEICDNNGKSAIQIARDNNHPDIAQLILNQLKNKLELKTTLSLRQEHSFFNYARTLHKVPTEDLYISYLKELITFNETEKKINNVTQLEAHFVQSRKLWGDVVSETYLANQQYCQEYAVKEKVIQRLKEMGTKYPIKTYHDAMAYIREDSVLTLSFDAAFLKHGLVDYQPLNIWQRNNKTPDYKKNRDAAERGLFSFLSEPLRTALFDNKDARPRYAAYWLPDKNTTRPHAVSYGSSFLVLKDVVKLNSIFSPGNPIGFKGANQRDYKVCTIHALELLLLQCQPATLQAIINKVTMGELNANNYDQNVIWDKNKGGHFEAMIPAFYFLNPDFVEHIHIDSTRYQLNPEEIAFIKSRGITVSNSPTPPYEELSKKFTNAKKEDINTLLEQYPLLRKIFLQQKLPIHIDELKTLLERLNDSANNQDYKHFIEAWEQLQASGFINEIDRSTTDYFNIFSNTTITLVFEKLVELKDEKIAKLFFDAKLIDIGNLVNNFLYPKYGLTQDSLFYKYINYTVESKDATFFNLLFSQIPKSHRIDFVELFIKECLTCLEKINHFLAYEVLIYLKQNNYLDLEPTLITPESNTILHAVYATHILYSLMHGKLLIPSQINFLENFQLELLKNLMNIIMRHHNNDEVR
ncbi:MAG: ankyrin repeat domain-containing protein, partial [Cellulomonas sp.]|nr:ankyrin repeat domain-containing protein [Rickettsiella sp.]